MKPGPERTCLGCRRARPKATLIRLVRGEDGRARVDPAGAGRGAYACPSEECVGRALSKGRLGHAFGRPTQPPAESPAEIVAAARETIPG